MKRTGLEGRVALVTGGGRGIGRAISLRLAEEGVTVALADLRGELAQSVADEIVAAGGRALATECDVTQDAQVQEMISQVVHDAGEINILVNNVGWDKVEPFINNTPQLWDKLIAVNLRAPIACTRAVLDGMIAREQGKIIFIGSDAGRVGSSGEAVYAGTKGGIIAFAKTLARELARYHINVNTVCPGPTDTPLFEEVSQGNERLIASLKAAIPLRRLATPEDIAGAVVFLASADADFITGQTLSVSGGLSMC